MKLVRVVTLRARCGVGARLFRACGPFVTDPVRAKALCDHAIVTADTRTHDGRVPLVRQFFLGNMLNVTSVAVCLTRGAITSDSSDSAYQHQEKRSLHATSIGSTVRRLYFFTTDLLLQEIAPDPTTRSPLVCRPRGRLRIHSTSAGR